MQLNYENYKTSVNNCRSL